MMGTDLSRSTNESAIMAATNPTSPPGVVISPTAPVHTVRLEGQMVSWGWGSSLEEKG